MPSEALAAAVEENLFGFFHTMWHWPEAEVHSGPDGLWTLTAIPFPLFNVHLRAAFTTDSADAGIEAAIGRCESRGVPMLWLTGPTTRPRDLSSRLDARGLSNRPQIGMALDLVTLRGEPPTPAAFAIEQVADAQALRTCCHVGCTTFGYPQIAEDAYVRWFTSVGLEPEGRLRHYICYLREEPVGSSALLVKGDVAGLYFVAILPHAQRQGIGSSMVLDLFCRARAAGASVCVLFAIPAIAGFYRRLGFRKVCSMASHIWSVQD